MKAWDTDHKHTTWRLAVLASAGFIGLSTSVQQLAEADNNLLNAPSRDLRAPNADSVQFELVDGRCDACHSVDSGAAHPVNVTASMDVPEWLPLEHNTLTCNTCHENADARMHALAVEFGDPLLRGGLTPQTLCVSCHEASFSSSASHASSLGWAHSETSSRSLASGFPSDHLVDEQSARCLSCHDGSYATDVSSGVGTPSLSSHPTDHPIGISMLDAHRRDTPLASPDSLDPRIQLYDGNIGCGSCHNLYSHLPDHLVMSNYQSKLCMSCHLF
ncbi:MAG: hypothetical protein ACYTF7_00440 [Planctomycetota bacterium]|jgi:hypothetical protein